MPFGVDMGGGYLSVAPDMSSFTRELTRGVREAARRAASAATVKMNVEFNTSQAVRAMRNLSRSLSGQAVTLNVDLDSAGARIQMARLERQLSRTISVKIDVDKGALSMLSGLFGGAGGGGQGGGGPGAGITSSISGLQGALGGLQSAASSAFGTISQGMSGLSQVGSILGQLGGVASKAGAGLGEAGGAAGAIAVPIAIIAAGIAVLVGTFVSLAAAAAIFTGVGIAVSAVMTAIAAAASVVGGAIAVLPGILGSAALAFGAILLVVQPLAEAFQAFNTVQDQAAQTGTKAAKTTLSNASAIKSATNAVSDARENEGRVAQTNARNIAAAERTVIDSVNTEKQAQKDVAQARRDATRELEDMANKAKDASLGEADASVAVFRAQEALNAVRQDGRSSAMDIQEAELRLAQAQQRSKESTVENKRAQEDNAKAQKAGVNGNKGVVDAEKAAADAKQAHIDAVNHQKQVEQDAAQASQDAAKNTARALESLAATQQKQTTAAGVATTANNNLTNALSKLSPAGKAFFDILKEFTPLLGAVSKIVQDSMLPALTPLLTVVMALFGQFKNGAFVLGPLGTVLQTMGTVIGLLGAQFGAMLGTMKNGKLVLGPLGDALITIANAGIQVAAAMGPSLITMITDIATGMADMAKVAGPVIDAFATGFEVIGKGMKGFFDALAQPGVMQGFADGISGIFGIVGDLLPLIGDFIGQLGKVGGPILKQLQPVVTQIFGALFTILKSLATPAVMGAFVVFAQAIADAFTMLANSGVIDKLATGFAQVVTAIAPMIPALVDSLIPVLPGLVDSFVSLSQTFIDMLPGLIPLVPLIFQMASFFIDMLIPILPELMDDFKAIAGLLAGQMVTSFLILLGVGIDFVVIIGRIIRGLFVGIKWVWENIGKPVFDFISNLILVTIPGAFATGVQFIKDKWDGLKGALSGAWTWVRDNVFGKMKTLITETIPNAFSTAVTSIGGFWDKLKKIATDPVNFVIDTVYNNGIRSLWNTITDKIGLKSLALGEIPKIKLARGGMLPGSSGMNYKDDRLASSPFGPVALAGGEYIVNAPQAKKNLGALHAINSGQDVPAFGFGGWLGDLVDKGKNAARGLVAPLVSEMKDKATATLNSIPGADTGMGQMVKEIPGALLTKMVDYFKNDDAANAPSIGGGGGFFNGVSLNAFNAAKGMKASNKVMMALLEAGIVESGMTNLDHGPDGSLGFLQQRPSWGSAASRMNVIDSAKRFVSAAKKIEGRYSTSGALAQGVQVSAFPLKYGQQESTAAALLASLTGGGTPGTGTGGSAGKPFTPGFKNQEATLRNAGFHLSFAPTQENKGTHSDTSWHYRNRAIDIGVGTNGQGTVEKVWQYLVKNYAANSKELFWAQKAVNYKNGQQVGPHDKTNHVHWAYGQGGLFPGGDISRYDNGGPLPPGMSTIYNGTGRPENVRTASEEDKVADLLRQLLEETRRQPGKLGKAVEGAMPDQVTLTDQQVLDSLNRSTGGSILPVGL